MRRAELTDLLRVWESAVGVAKPLRGLAMLTALGPETKADTTTPLAAVEAALAERRSEWFGPVVPMMAACPGCGAEYEMQLDLTALGWVAARLDPVEIGHAHGVMAVRPPCTGDLVALAHISHPDAFADALFRRCLVDAAGSRDAAVAPALRADAADALSRAGHGPRLIDVACEACGASWQPLVDIAGILWTEIDARARRVLHEVQLLAAAFHWSERDILALSPARREFYLAAIG